MKTAMHILTHMQRITTPDTSFAAPLGIESEIFVYDEDEKPVDLTQHLELLRAMPDVWACGTDLGKNMLEIAFNPKRNVRGYIRSWLDALAFLAKNEESKQWRLLFSGDARGTHGWVTKQRYAAAIDGITRESDDGHRVIECMTSHAAFQVNVGVGQFGGVFSHEAKKLLYAFNNWGPALCLYFEKKADDLKSARLSHGYDCMTPIRGPRYLSWNFCDNLETEILDIPQLIVCKPHDVWEYSGKKPSEISPIHTGTIYWMARAQGVYDKDAARIEIRSLNSMSPEISVDAVMIINHLVSFVLETDAKDLPVLSKDTWSLIKQKEHPETSLSAALLFLETLPITK